MSIGGKPVTLDPAKDVLMNVNALGNPVPSARFMGGWEFDIVVSGRHAEPADADKETALAERIMLLPVAVTDTGPFQGQMSHWTPREPQLGSGSRMVATSYYLALVTKRCLDLIGDKGTVVVEGPFARNSDYCAMLAVASKSPVTNTGSATGTSQGAALLAVFGTVPTCPKPCRQTRI